MFITPGVFPFTEEDELRHHRLLQDVELTKHHDHSVSSREYCYFEYVMN
ncbi:hypothetical protein APHCRT_0625 [Anaplasma phagocytophilum str. CRT53-1]|uniref:Uncharacterized protein n=1 Tax=Anaplasma phagocytophilum str. CRT53-1 TaxID=1359157 RepID=A0A0F3Q0N7_ANAPH|nr:hypothetical protein APHCRT_0613 [Anaplasma phagocytophilum str. CRT53-1]KJV86202.1 hypothetical protein APHCRT_0625 [Anaplasma phagocytophilum str. CRT53-1]